jgi:hypothetical protein
MDMFGGLTKTSSRIAIAAALGLTLGGFAFKATPAKAADLGGDCCADLEERVAELEATTVRKGNKKVSVTLSGWVIKSLNWWSDEEDSSFAVGDKDYDLASRFAITGSATISPGWTAGFNMTVTATGSTFGILSNQNDEYDSVNPAQYGNTIGAINTLYSFIYIKSDHWGALNWGLLSPASDNPAVLADISGTVIESNFVGFEGAGFFLSERGNRNNALSLNFWACDSLIAPGADCFGTAEPAVRYDSPTWGGFRFETSTGTNALLPELVDAIVFDYPAGTGFGAFLPRTQDSHFWDLALFYTADWNSIKISLAGAYTWIESNPINGAQENYWQVGGTIMHKPSGLGIYATGNWEQVDSANNCTNQGCLNNLGLFTTATPPDTDMWGVKPFWRKAWSPIGATVLYGEFAQYNDFFGRANVLGQANTLNFCLAGSGNCTITGSQFERWGLGVVQEIDSAAMHVWLRWQHQEVDADVLDLVTGNRGGTDFNDWDLIQAGGVIFF